MIKTVALKLYQKMYNHRVTMSIALRIKDIGLSRKIRMILSDKTDNKKCHSDISKQLTKKFLNDNTERIDRCLSYLADDKSRSVWQAVMNHRAYDMRIPEELYSENDQYFVDGIIGLIEKEVFVDCGAWRGDSIERIIRHCKQEKKCISRIIAFEPDPDNIRFLYKFYKRNKMVKIIKAGVSGKKGILYLNSNGTTSSLSDCETVEGMVEVPVINLDKVKNCQGASYIKMDIEGAEMDALIGAHKLISRNHPKIAVCIYHSLEDMLRIIEYFHNEWPEYDLYVRHHTNNDTETVLYAI